MSGNIPNRSSGKSSHVARKWMAFFHGLGLACGLILSSGLIVKYFREPAPGSSHSPVAPVANRSGVLQVSGPWGNLQVETIYTEKPAHFIDAAPLLRSEEKWLFSDMDQAGVRQWMLGNGFSPEATEVLVTANPVKDSQGIYLHPTQEWIAQMDPSLRKKIHGLLAKNPFNYYSENPYLFSSDVLQQIRSHPVMDEKNRRLFDKLLYPRGKAMCLSDIGCLLFNLKNTNQCAEWLKLLTRTKTLLLKLEIDGTSNIPALVDYWAGPFNLKDFQPLLESLKREDQISRLDVIHLLPPVARQLTYTYPLEDGLGEKRDCHWTSINFFEESKNDLYLDSREIAKEIEANYITVEKPEKFGDILMFTTNGTEISHSCIYIAADMVFTKNGRGVHQPWTISTLQDVASMYGEMRILVKRRK
jgi:hypothetical protein